MFFLRTNNRKREQ